MLLVVKQPEALDELRNDRHEAFARKIDYFERLHLGVDLSDCHQGVFTRDRFSFNHYDWTKLG